MAARTFRELAERFLEAKRLYLKPKSLESYKVCVNRLAVAGFGRWQANRIGPKQIDAYIEFERGRGMVDGAINVRLRALRAILKWAADPDVGLLEKAPRVRLLRVPVGLGGAPLGRADLERLLAQGNVRDRALISVLVGGGLRIDEALHLQWTDLEDGRLSVTAKDGWSPKSHQERVVYLPDPALAALEALREHDRRRLGLPELRDGWVFRSQRGKRLKHAAALGRGLFQRAGIHQRGRVWHELRRAAASAWSRNGAPVDVIMKALGHRKLETTQRYLLLDQDALKDLARRGLV